MNFRHCLFPIAYSLFLVVYLGTITYLYRKYYDLSLLRISSGTLTVKSLRLLLRILDHGRLKCLNQVWASRPPQPDALKLTKAFSNLNHGKYY